MTATNKDGSIRGEGIAEARENGISENTYYARVHMLGMSPEKAATQPLRENKRHLQTGDRELIEGLHDEDVAPRHIAEKMEIPPSAVHRVLCRMRKRRREENE